MGFKFAARTLLELGKELISTDEVALYELIKNAIDAKTDVVEIEFQIILQHSHFKEALAALKDGSSPRDVISGIQKRLLLDSNVELREEFMSDLEEKSDNPSLFRKTLRSVYASYNWIEVRDKGHGMTLKELDDVYLTVGTRSRREENIHGAAFLGDKGVGRLSAMRLGERLEVFSSRRGDRNINVLDIDWGLFGHETAGHVEDVAVAPERGERKTDAAEHGTTLRISNLSGDWSRVNVADLLNGPIARMVDPFVPGRGNELIHVVHNETRILIPSIPQQLLKAAHATCKVTLKFEGDEPVLSGSVDYSLRNAKVLVMARGAEVYSVAQHSVKRRGKLGNAAVEFTPIRPDALRQLGPFEVEVYWYNRSIVEAVDGLTEKRAQTKEQIAMWAGGPMLYRHGFRVLPYGDPDDDWLEMDKRAFAQSGFKLNRQQVIGRINVHSAHTALSEQTNREGLIQSDAAEALKTMLIWVMHVEMRNLINEADEIERLEASADLDKSLSDFHRSEQKVEDSLIQLSVNVPESSRPALERVQSSVHTLILKCAETIGKTESALSNAVNEREKFVYLAGLGLMTEFIFHELDRSLRHALSIIKDVRKQTPRSGTLMALEEQLATLHKRVSAFDELTGEKRQTKVKFDLNDLVKSLLVSHSREFERHGIAAIFIPSAPYEIKAVKGMVIQILENLVANSTYWLKQQKAYEPGFTPEIRFEIDKKNQTLSVSDNGPGVDPSRSERIFQPFVTTKPAGQGRGLGLYISREVAEYHGWTLQMDKQVSEYRRGRLNTFVLNLGGQ